MTKTLKTVGIIATVTWVTLVSYSTLYTMLKTNQGKAVLVSILVSSIFISGLTLLVNYLVNKNRDTPT